MNLNESLNPIHIGCDIHTYVPTVDYYLNLLENDIRFKFIRLNHGVCDSIAEVFSNEELDSLLEKNNYDIISKKIANFHEKNNGYLKSWSTLDNRFIPKLSFFIKFFYENIQNENSKFDYGVSMCNGIYQFRDVNFSKHTANRARIIKSLSKYTTRPFFHGGIPRHFCVTGEIYKFFDKLNELDYDVIMFGPPYLKMIEYEFNIKNFKHIVIPYRNAVTIIDDKINSLIDSINKPKTIVLNSTGHILSAYLFGKLENIDVTQFDVGRALDWNLNKSFINGKFKLQFDSLDANNYKPWKKYDENPWLVGPIDSHKKIINLLRNNE